MNGAYIPASAAQLAAAVQSAQVIAHPGQWAVNNVPAANTQATVSKAAGGAGVRHVLQAILAAAVSDSAAPAAIARAVYVRDGASGVGTIIWAGYCALPAVAGEKSEIALSGLNIVGSANSAMTIEYSQAMGANTYQSVSMAGMSVI